VCGIAGWIDWRGGKPKGDLLRAMTRVLSHRGPDDEGYFEDSHAHLGHRRLSIIDLESGDQPMCNEDGTIWIVFNGEVYNFQELRAQLEGRGHRFQTQSDTESIIHLYEENGEACVQRLRGQFAFALWDARQRKLLLARDRMGQKPLYYSQRNSRFLFASELRSLLQDPTVSDEIDPEGLDACVAYKYIPEPYSILRDVRKLPAAHLMVVTAEQTRIERYWQVDFSSPKSISEGEALEQLDSLLEESTRLRMIADVPLGAFLSGGIDSSLIVSYMRRVAGQQIKTFSIGFDEARYDERSYARQVAEHFGTDHHEFVVRPTSLADLLQISSCFDEPFADSSGLAVYYVSQMARQHVTVALNGDGGDESFAGYERYHGMVLFDYYRALPGWVRGAANFAAAAFSATPLRRARPLLRLRDWNAYAKLSRGELYERCVGFPAETRWPLYGDRVKQALQERGGVELFAPWVEQCRSNHTINRVMYADQQVYLPADLLVKVDRMTMAHSLEGRSPLLDHHVVEFAASLPGQLKFKWWRQKYLLKKLLSRHFPRRFVYRPKKGFNVPVAEWMHAEKTSLMREYIAESELVRAGYFDASATQRLFDQYLGHPVQSKLLWSILALEIWYRNLITVRSHLVC